MPSPDPASGLAKVGYVVKRYPRYSETFIVNEVLAHEAAGLAVEIFSLLPATDTHFQDAIARVRAPVTYLLPESPRAAEFWQRMEEASAAFPGFWASLESARGSEARDLFQAILLALAARRRGVTHLHAHFATSPASVARLASRFAGVPYSFTAHAKDIFHEDVDAADLRRKLADAAAVITVSDFNLRHLREAFGADAARVRRVYNGMDLARLEYAEPVRREPLVLAVGRLVEKKGFPVLLDACTLLAHRGVEFRCVVVGQGEQAAALEAQVRRLGLGGVVELAGPRPQEEVFGLIRSAAVLAAPCIVGSDSNRDGLPTVLLESMALGTPCISTDVTGIPEVVRHGETGLLVPQGDAAALAAALERLLADAALRVTLAAEARRLVERAFDVRATSAELRRIFARTGHGATAGEG